MRLFVLAMAGVIVSSGSLFSAEPGAVPFMKHRIGTYRSEACNVGDFNNDGKLDIVAGPFVYLAPDFKPVKIRELVGSVDEAGKGYMHDFANLPIDVDGDGFLDVAAAMWHEKQIVWYRNPGKLGELWVESVIEKNGNFESADLVDINGDGKRNEILGDTQRTVWYGVEKKPDGKQGLGIHVVSEKPMPFGGGAGDINGDGRPDILRPTAWFEAPADPVKGEWKEHPIPPYTLDGKPEHTAQMVVYDVNGDGLNDIIVSSAHRYGIFWLEQTRTNGEISFKPHLIDKSWTQAHSISLGDINGDGLMDFVTGKRFMAHNGSDPEETAPLGVYWYELKRNPDKSVTWIKHPISYDEGIGAGINNVVVDLDGDGDLDVVVTGKYGGPVWFENKLK